MKKYHKTIDWQKIEKGPEMDNTQDVKRTFMKNNTGK